MKWKIIKVTEQLLTQWQSDPDAFREAMVERGYDSTNPWPVTGVLKSTGDTVAYAMGDFNAAALPSSYVPQALEVVAELESDAAMREWVAANIEPQEEV